MEEIPISSSLSARKLRLALDEGQREQTMHSGLNQSPIHGYINPAQFYPSPAHEEALARLHYLVEQHLRLGVLLGGVGSGKSMLLAKLASDLHAADRHVARISLLGLSSEEFLYHLAVQLQACPASPASALQLVQRWITSS